MSASMILVNNLASENGAGPVQRCCCQCRVETERQDQSARGTLTAPKKSRSEIALMNEHHGIGGHFVPGDLSSLRPFAILTPGVSVTAPHSERPSICRPSTSLRAEKTNRTP